MGDVYVVEYTDPQCVWAWSSEPKLRWLRARYGDQLHWRRVFGVQVHDLEVTHPDDAPELSAEAFRAGWVDVAGHTGAPIAPWLEWSSSSSRRASLTAKAAELQGPEIAEHVLRRLREAVFVAGRSVDTPSRIADAVAGVPALDVPRLLADAASTRTRVALRADFEETRNPDPEVIGLEHASPNPGAARPAGERLRYSFPTLIISGPGGRRIVPGWRTAETYDDAVRAVAPFASPSQKPPIDAANALERYRSLSLAELELLTGSQLPPLEAVPIITSTTPLFVHADDVANGPLARLAGAISLTN
jgi:predicted DsbA family dithiol-disulfide isomerase